MIVLHIQNSQVVTTLTIRKEFKEMLFSLNFALKEDIFAPFIEKKLPVKFIILE
jgi:hypothetical protein